MCLVYFDSGLVTILWYKLDFSSCVIWNGLCKSSYNIMNSDPCDMGHMCRAALACNTKQTKLMNSSTQCMEWVIFQKDSMIDLKIAIQG